jgi:hypothetical protein
MNEILLPKARLYAARRQLDLTETLGSGKDGIVLVAKHKNKPADVAIKILRLEEPYVREKRAYQRLGMAAVTTVLGFNVPELINFDDELLALEMTIVRRPFVLDFASAWPNQSLFQAHGFLVNLCSSVAAFVQDLFLGRQKR